MEGDILKLWLWARRPRKFLSICSSQAICACPRSEALLVVISQGQVRLVELHDGSHIQLRKLEADYGPTDKVAAMHRLQEAQQSGELITGLVYYDSRRPSLVEMSQLVDTPLSLLSQEKLRPSPQALSEVMGELM